jgi:hypothetical protein
VKRVFISYGRENAPQASALTADVSELGYEVWLDKELTGGQAWWNQILRRIRDCDAFLFGLSPESLESPACDREWRYATELGKSILPVLVAGDISDDLLPPRLAEIQYVDYRRPEKQAVIQLMKALSALPAPQTLPDPLPAPPEVPLSYLGSLREQVQASRTLSFEEQAVLLVKMKQGLREAKKRDEVGKLLRLFRSRDDLLARVADEVDELLADLSKAASPQAASAVRRQPEGETKQRAEQEARRRAEEEAKQRAEQEARRRAEEEAKQRAEQEVRRRKAQAEAKQRTEYEGRLNTEQQPQQRQTSRRLLGIAIVLLILAGVSYSLYPRFKPTSPPELDVVVERIPPIKPPVVVESTLITKPPVIVEPTPPTSPPAKVEKFVFQGTVDRMAVDTYLDFSSDGKVVGYWTVTNRPSLAGIRYRLEGTRHGAELRLREFSADGKHEQDVKLTANASFTELVGEAKNLLPPDENKIWVVKLMRR